MDRELLKHCLVYHGESLLNKLKCEQKENPDFQAVISDLCKASYERYVTKKICRPFIRSSFCRETIVKMKLMTSNAVLQYLISTKLLKDI